MSEHKDDLSRRDPQFDRALSAMKDYQVARRDHFERQAVRALRSLQVEEDIKKLPLVELHKQAWRATRRRHVEELRTLRADRIMNSPRGLAAAILKFVGINAILSEVQRRENRRLLSGQRVERSELLAQKRNDLLICGLPVYSHHQKTAMKLEALTALDTREGTAMIRESIRWWNCHTSGVADQAARVMPEKEHAPEKMEYPECMRFFGQLPKRPIEIPAINKAFRRAIASGRDKGR
jgi:hypothetical protein